MTQHGIQPAQILQVHLDVENLLVCPLDVLNGPLQGRDTALPESALVEAGHVVARQQAVLPQRLDLRGREAHRLQFRQGVLVIIDELASTGAGLSHHDFPLWLGKECRAC